MSNIRIQVYNQLELGVENQIYQQLRNKTMNIECQARNRVGDKMWSQNLILVNLQNQTMDQIWGSIQDQMGNLINA